MSLNLLNILWSMVVIIFYLYIIYTVISEELLNKQKGGNDDIHQNHINR